MSGDRVNCDLCGRDTTAKSRLCKYCLSSTAKHTETQDDRDRAAYHDREDYSREAEIEAEIVDALGIDD